MGGKSVIWGQLQEFFSLSRKSVLSSKRIKYFWWEFLCLGGESVLSSERKFFSLFERVSFLD